MVGKVPKKVKTYCFLLNGISKKRDIDVASVEVGLLECVGDVNFLGNNSVKLSK